MGKTKQTPIKEQNPQERVNNFEEVCLIKNS